MCRHPGTRGFKSQWDRWIQVRVGQVDSSRSGTGGFKSQWDRWIQGRAARTDSFETSRPAPPPEYNERVYAATSPTEPKKLPALQPPTQETFHTS